MALMLPAVLSSAFHAPSASSRWSLTRSTSTVKMTTIEGDPLQLATVSKQLQESLSIPSLEAPLPAEDAAAQLILVHNNEVAQMAPKIWSPSIQEEERVDTIKSLAQVLDTLEDLAVGPMLAGKKVSLVDSVIFPSMAALESTLPQHFGWTEWTDEALFWRRPRLHAWWELITSHMDRMHELESLLATELRCGGHAGRLRCGGGHAVRLQRSGLAVSRVRLSGRAVRLR